MPNINKTRKTGGGAYMRMGLESDVFFCLHVGGPITRGGGGF